MYIIFTTYILLLNFILKKFMVLNFIINVYLKLKENINTVASFYTKKKKRFAIA
jgi:hypothetical protein